MIIAIEGGMMTSITPVAVTRLRERCHCRAVVEWPPAPVASLHDLREAVGEWMRHTPAQRIVVIDTYDQHERIDVGWTRFHAIGMFEAMAPTSGVCQDRDDLDSVVSCRGVDLVSRHGRTGAARRRAMSVKFRVELIWKDSDESVAESIFLTSDGRVILQGRAVSPAERQALSLPEEPGLISVDRKLIRAIKDML
jgi:hypothetical protein